MYHEPLDPMAAQNILGDKYNPDHSYFLMSDRDQFIVGETDSTGKLIDEIRLEENEHDYTEEDVSLEELFDVESDDDDKLPKDKVQEINRWLTIGMVIIMLIVAGVIVVTLISQ